ncbi:aldehyde-activating protein [Desulfobacter hydrogenophilus]|uniref:Aldehyde-activating protein n=1 Tax=Desulfobacter hydrogenophilus TaxID=2291 RepID=A0A328FF16_9BACT|nr:GFA family protein [Desulfobacter hydrogenophilus]NDY73360.1 GFA family protein [Desulfobacter hydrogenophilus]QBH14035.1 aldehyde-activating protein [Desulfobacter hydrogenophilus]RAM01597.1 aldehyde-activating protein [Desulfobacter hydrogenophilus]
MKYKGSCLCGEIAFEIIGEFESFFLCHCERCRKDTGSAHAANLFSSSAKLIWLSGKDKAKTFDFKSEGHIKSFCSNCGSALPNIQMDGDLLVVPAGSLDSDVQMEPQGHIYWRDKANWDNNLEKVAKFDQLPNQNNM